MHTCFFIMDDYRYFKIIKIIQEKKRNPTGFITTTSKNYFSLQYLDFH